MNKIPTHNCNDFLRVMKEMRRQEGFLQERRNTFTSIRSLKQGDEYYEHKDFLMKSALDWIRFHTVLVDLWKCGLAQDMKGATPLIFKLRDIVVKLQENNESAVEYGIYNEENYLFLCEKIKNEYNKWNELITP